MRQSIYNNADSIYPFTQSINGYDLSFISNISICIKDTNIKKSDIFISLMEFKDSIFKLVFTKNSGQILAYLQMQDSLWGTINSEYLFGFIYLNSFPAAQFVINKKLDLNQRIFTMPIKNTNLIGLKIQNQILNNPVLKMQIHGNLQVSEIGQTIKIQRNQDPLYVYAAQNTLSPFYISSINGFTANTLRIKTTNKDKISISGNDQGYIYFQSGDEFPGCPNKGDSIKW